MMLYVGEGSKREQCHQFNSLVAFSHSCCYSQANQALLVLISREVGGFVYVLGPCGSLQWTLLWGWEFLPPPQPSQFFSVIGFEDLFPHNGMMGHAVCLTPQLFLMVYLYTYMGPPGLPATISPILPAATLPWVLSACLHPSYQSGWMFLL